MPPMLVSPRSPNRGELFFQRVRESWMARISSSEAAPISWLHVVGLIVVLWAVSSDSLAQARDLVVTEVRGNAVRSNSSAVRTLDTLKVGERVRLSSDSRVSLFADQDAKLYEIDGPAEIQLSPKGVLVNGKAVEARKLDDAYRNVKVNGSELVQGSMVMRSNASLRLLGPEGTVAPASAREFRWVQQPGTWRFELATDAGILMHRAEARDGRMTLPANVTLENGVHYVWGVLPSQGGTTPADWTEFLVNESQAFPARPGADATSSERVVYGAWLKSRGLNRAALRFASGAAQ